MLIKSYHFTWDYHILLHKTSHTSFSSGFHVSVAERAHLLFLRGKIACGITTTLVPKKDELFLQLLMSKLNRSELFLLNFTFRSWVMRFSNLPIFQNILRRFCAEKLIENFLDVKICQEAEEVGRKKKKLGTALSQCF